MISGHAFDPEFVQRRLSYAMAALQDTETSGFNTICFFQYGTTIVV
jgi:hypothetical protein